MQQIDFSTLQEEVIDQWEENGYDYREFDMDTNELLYKKDAEFVLQNIDDMINELGFDSIANYILSKQEEV